MSQDFQEQLTACGYPKNRLLSLMSDLDAEKRSLKSRLSRLSSEPTGKFGRGRERQVQIRKIKDRMSFLTEEREVVRARLGAIKLNRKALNKAVNSRTPSFAHAFVAAAERTLSEEQFLSLESLAGQILLETEDD